MRCQFCGFDNPPERTNCEKCSRPLTNENHNKSGQNPATGGGRPTVVRPQADNMSNLRATVREQPTSQTDQSEVSPSVCPNCGYPLEQGSCSNCGYSSERSVTPRPAQNFGRSTVRPARKKVEVAPESIFTLTPIAEETGLPQGEPLVFEGTSVSLNRENTSPENKTITSSTQANITFENGEWAITDNSEYKTTFVQASDKIRLGKGSLILLDDQLFRFDTSD